VTWHKAGALFQETWQAIGGPRSERVKLRRPDQLADPAAPIQALYGPAPYGWRNALRLLAIAAVLTGIACAGAVAEGSSSGISGRVVTGPTCPVERVPPAPGCAPRPLAATLRIEGVGRRNQSWSVRSGHNGRFRISLPASTYTVRALPVGRSPFPRPPSPLRLRVHEGRFTAVTVTYDTGIR
jgi:hypothetical protein